MNTMKSKHPRMFSGTRSYNKFDIAVGQLETAIRLFLQDGCDMFSAITLAGSAGEVLHGLVVKARRKPFVDEVVQMNASPTPSRSQVIKHINATLFINEMKHYDDRNEEVIEFDAEECAMGAILKAIADYKTLTHTESAAMKAFIAWTYVNLDSDEVMKRYKETER